METKKRGPEEIGARQETAAAEEVDGGNALEGDGLAGDSLAGNATTEGSPAVGDREAGAPGKAPTAKNLATDVPAENGSAAGAPAGNIPVVGGLEAGAPAAKVPAENAPAAPTPSTRIPPRKWFFTFMCMNIPIIGWIYLLTKAFGKKDNPLKDFSRAYLLYKLVFLIVALVILGIVAYIGLGILDELLAYMEML